MARQITTRVGKQHGQTEQPMETTDACGMEQYMANLHTYLLALGIIGSDEIQGAPDEEPFGSDSTKFVRAP